MKKKIFVVALAVCLLAVSIVGSSMAYFTDTEQYTNTFTIGNVAITLTAGGQTVDGQTLELADANVYPSNVLNKNVTITNTSANDAAYVGAIVTLQNVDGRLGLTADTVKTFLTGGLMSDSTNNATVEVVDDGNGTITIYVVANAAVVKGGTALIFENIAIPAAWNNEQMGAFANLKLDVKAYATQTAGMTDGALKALQAAFDAFDSLN